MRATPKNALAVLIVLLVIVLYLWYEARTLIPSH
jgi:hypothetical protein